MRLAILILAAVAAFAQEDKLQVAGSGTVLIGSAVEWRSNDAKYLVVDVGQPYAKFALIIRDAAREPIAFCNIKLGRCWDVKWSWEREQLEAAARPETAAIRIYDTGEVWGATKVTVCCSGSQSSKLIEFDKTGKVIRETK